jgi:hypothetical protein
MVVFLAGNGIASAAQFSTVNSKNGKTRIDLKGDIEPGDANKLRELVEAANTADRVVVTIRLNSNGGNLLEGVSIADIVRKGRIKTSVLAGAHCASACFIIFAAGYERFADYTALIGVHGASDENGQETVQSGAATVTMARIVRELGVPPSVIGKMVVTPPDKIVWLSVDDLRAMDVIMFGRPLQIQPEITATPQLPHQISPNTQATVTVPPTWNEYFKKAIATSANQNHGQPRFFRGCQPEIKSCVWGVIYSIKGGAEASARITEDMNGKTIRRESCEFNIFGDVRTCLNWDTGVTHKDMKNVKGEWYQVSQ